MIIKRVVCTILIIFSFLESQVQAGTASIATAAPYENKEHGIAFDLPAGWKVLPASTINALVKKATVSDAKLGESAKNELKKWNEKPDQQVSFSKLLAPGQMAGIELLFRSVGGGKSTAVENILGELDSVYLKDKPLNGYVVRPTPQTVDGCSAAHAILKFTLQIAGHSPIELTKNELLIRKEDHLFKLSLTVPSRSDLLVEPEFTQIMKSIKIKSCKN